MCLNNLNYIGSLRILLVRAFDKPMTNLIPHSAGFIRNFQVFHKILHFFIIFPLCCMQIQKLSIKFQNMKQNSSTSGTALAWCQWCYSTKDFGHFAPINHSKFQSCLVMVARMLIAPRIFKPNAVPDTYIQEKSKSSSVLYFYEEL